MKRQTKELKQTACQLMSLLALIALVMAPFMALIVPEETAAKSNVKGSVVGTNYDIRIKLDDKKDRIYENVRIDLTNKTNRSVSKIYVREMTKPLIDYAKKNHASEGNTKKKAKVQDVRYLGESSPKAAAKLNKKTGKKLSFKRTGKDSSIMIRLPKGKALAPGKSASIRVKLMTDIPARQDRFSVTKTKKGKLYLLSFCFPRLNDNKNGKWQLDPFFDDGESRPYTLTDFNIRLETPAKYKAAISGKETSRIIKKKSAGSVKKFRVTTAKANDFRDIAVCCSDFMDKDSFTVRGIKINNYYLKGKYTKLYRRVTKMVAKDSINNFTKKLGKIPYDEIDSVQSLFGFGLGGMEYTGLIMINGSRFFDGDSAKYACTDVQEAYAHELCHQWFFSTVGNREFKAAWIDEGFTTFATREYYCYVPSKSNSFIIKYDGLKSLKKQLADRASDLEDELRIKMKLYVNIPPDKYPKDRTYGTYEYEESDFFLQAVQKKIGKKQFLKFIREYYRSYYNKVATTRDVIRIMRKHAKLSKKSKEVEKLIKKYISSKYL